MKDFCFQPNCNVIIFTSPLSLFHSAADNHIFLLNFSAFVHYCRTKLSPEYGSCTEHSHLTSQLIFNQPGTPVNHKHSNRQSAGQVEKRRVHVCVCSHVTNPNISILFFAALRETSISALDALRLIMNINPCLLSNLVAQMQ